jgi:aldose sugar dehydrogenase
MVLIAGHFSLSYTAVSGSQSSEYPMLMDPNLRTEVVFKGIKFPTSMAFLSANDILVLEKNEGTVKRIINGTMLDKPLLDLNVATNNERGMLGIAVAQNQSDTKTYVFLYLTESGGGADLEGTDISSGRLYRYELIMNKLANPKLLLDIPFKSSSIAQHYGGKLIAGANSTIYLIIGDYGGQRTETQNFHRSGITNGTSVIYKISYDGESMDNILSDEYPYNKYYAYGIRNSFGMDFDPVTGNLWDTENGNTFGDEINLVIPGFNSGWGRVQGFWEVINPERRDPPNIKNIILKPNNLFDFGGRGNYSSPEFTWEDAVGITAITFLSSEKYGNQYENDIIIGDFNNGNLYRFDLVENRTALDLHGPLADKVANGEDVLTEVLFGQHFGAITDMKVGPDGYLYVLCLYQGANNYTELSESDRVQFNSDIPGTLFRIVPLIR